jgi:hypothetical protein
MLLTILLMAGGSMVIAILPTYEQVGWLAPILLLLARIAQGMSLGGEVSNASAYLGEIAPPAHRGRYSSFFYISTGSALLAASLLGVLLTSVLDNDQLEAYGWRIAFFVGGLLGLVGMWLRRSLVETEQFEENAEKARATKNPLLQTIKHHPKAVVQLCAFTLLSTLSYYTFFSALTPFAITFRDADKTDVFIALSIGTALFVALCYPSGRCRTGSAASRSCCLVRRDGGAHRAAVLPGPGQPVLADRRLLRRAGALRADGLDRPGDHERAVPHRAAGHRDRRLVQPHGRRVRRDGAAGDHRAVRGRPPAVVLLVRRDRRRRGLRRHPDPARDQGVRAALRPGDDD